MNHSLNKTISWIENNIEHFKLNENKYTNDIYSTIKPFGELVLTCSLLKRNGLNDVRIETIINWAWQEINSGEQLINLLIARNDLIVLSSIYADFKSIGFNSEGLNYLVKYLNQINPISNMESPYWKQLDVTYILSKLEIKKFPKNALKKSWLGKKSPPWLINNDLAYAITHEIFYATDFGLLPNRVENEIKIYLEIWVFAWIEIYKQANNYDIIIELAMVCLCLRIEIPKMIEDDIYKSQKIDGSFPGPENGGSSLLKEDDLPERIEFITNYHTTLVGCIFMMMNYKKLPTTAVTSSCSFVLIVKSFS